MQNYLLLAAKPPNQAATFASTALALAPIGWWRAGEPSGTTAVDASTGGHNGTYVGTPTLGAAGLVTDGDTAVTLNGTSQSISLPVGVVLGDTFSLVLMVKRARTGDEVLVDAIGNISFQFRSTDKIGAVKAGGGVIAVSTVAITDTAIHQVAWTRSGSGTDKLWIDTVDVTGSVSGFSSMAMAGGRIGADQGNTCCWVGGTIDEPLFFNRVVSQAELISLYAFHA